MFFTKQQVERLEKYRKTFETAVRSNFARNVGSIALKEIEDIYDEACRSHYSYNRGCSICVLSFLKKVGEPFLKDSAAYKEIDEEEQEKKRLEEEEKEELQQTETEEVVEPVNITGNIIQVPEEVLIEANKPQQENKPKRTRRKKDDTEQ